MDIQELRDRAFEEESNAGKIVAGVLIGVGVGIVAGLLLAPKSGKDTIQQVSDMGGEWKKNLGTLVDRLSNIANDYIQAGKNGVKRNSGVEA